MLDFVFWILDLVLDFGFGTLDFEFWVLGVGFWVTKGGGWNPMKAQNL